MALSVPCVAGPFAGLHCTLTLLRSSIRTSPLMNGGYGRDVTIAVGRHTRMPRNYRGMDIYWWLDRLGLLDTTIDQMPDRLLARRARELRPGLPVMYTSGKRAVIEHLDPVEGSMFLPKPYDPFNIAPLLDYIVSAKKIGGSRPAA